MPRNNLTPFGKEIAWFILVLPTIYFLGWCVFMLTGRETLEIGSSDLTAAILYNLSSLVLYAKEGSAIWNPYLFSGMPSILVGWYPGFVPIVRESLLQWAMALPLMVVLGLLSFRSYAGVWLAIGVAFLGVFVDLVRPVEVNTFPLLGHLALAMSLFLFLLWLITQGESDVS